MTNNGEYELNKIDTKAIVCEVLTKFTTDVLLSFLAAGVVYDQSLDQWYSKIDQLPPFDISLLFSNESGYASYQRILGVEFVTSGDVVSIQDMMTEQTISYLASDFTPLLPPEPGPFVLSQHKHLARTREEINQHRADEVVPNVPAVIYRFSTFILAWQKKGSEHGGKLLLLRRTIGCETRTCF